MDALLLSPDIQRFVTDRRLVLAAGLGFDDWDALGAHLCSLQDSIEQAQATVRLWRADWWRFGVEAYGHDRAVHAVAAFGVSSRSIANDVSATRNLSSEARRVEGATFEQLAAASAFVPADQQAGVLVQAVEHGWRGDDIDLAVNGEAAIDRARVRAMQAIKLAYHRLDDVGRREFHLWIQSRIESTSDV